MRIVRFHVEHARNANAHTTQAGFQWMLDKPDLIPGEVYAALEGDTLLAIGSVTDVAGKAGGWMLFTDRIEPRHFLPLHRAVLRVLRELEAIGDPMFAHIDESRPRAVRWARLLGLAPSGVADGVLARYA